MKTKAILLILLFTVLAVACERGTTKQRLTGDEAGLPPELKGLKVYTVSTGISDVKVAILNGEVNSLTYPVGKTQSTTVIINKDRYNERIIEGTKILFENDEMVLVKK